MNRRELVRAVAAHTSSDPKQVDATLAGLVEVVTSVVSKGDPVTIPGFVKFSKVHRAARTARNPQTGEPVQVKARTVAKATAMKAFKDQVMTPTKAPRLAKGVWPTSPDLLSKQAADRKAAAQPSSRTSGAKKSTARAGGSKKAKTSGSKKSAAKRSAGRKTTKKSAARRR